MTQKKTQHNGSSGKIAAAAVIGAAAGVAAAVLSKKENREKVAKTATDLKDQALKHGKNLQEEFEKSDTTKEVQKKLDDASKTLKEVQKDLE